MESAMQSTILNPQSVNPQSPISNLQSPISNLQSSMYGARLLVHVVHQDVAAERARGGEVGLAVADLRHLADEADQVVVARQHEGVDQDAGLTAGGDFGERLRDDERIEAEGVAVDAPVGARER